MPIWIGGMVKAFSDKVRGVKEESELSSGMLYSTGLVAGGSIAGVLIALLVAAGTRWEIHKQPLDQFLNIGNNYFTRMGIAGDVIGWAIFAILAAILFRSSMAKMEE
jgi:hypothetical protein